jgi:hypothetical protein
VVVSLGKVEAACINQEDIKERSQQVSLMADIYRKAKLVFAYVGEADQFTKSALQLAFEVWRTMPWKYGYLTTLTLNAGSGPR